MKKINYKSFTSVNDKYKEMNKIARDEGYFFPASKLNGFFPENYYINKSQIYKECLFGNIEERKTSYIGFNIIDYPYVYKRIKTRLSITKPKKSYIKNQIMSFMKLLATNPNEANFVGSLLISIYEATDFKSKENRGKVATDEEKKTLLDIPLKILKANKDIKTFKRRVLYEMLSPDLCQFELFNENVLLASLLQNEEFQNKHKREYNLALEEIKNRHK
ncbi:hypothetical protein HDR59_04445 [bacterium]|nr:hypothetical protein [bacterium]